MAHPAPSPLSRPQPSPAAGRWVQGLPWLLLAAGLITTSIVWWNVRGDGSSAQQREFEAEAGAVVKAVEGRLQTTAELLQGFGGLFAATPKLDRDGFLAYVRAGQLETRHPAVQAVGFAVAAGTPPLRASLAYLVPEGQPNLPAPGSDLFADPLWRDSLEGALARRTVALSARLKAGSVDDGPDQAGFLIVAPSYRTDTGPAELLGWAFARIAAKPLLAGTLGANPGGDRLRMRIRDGGVGGNGSLIYDSRPATDTAPASRWRSQREIAFGGHTWTVELEALPAFATAAPQVLGGRVLAAGVLLSLVLAVLARILVASHRQVAAALDEAAHSNRELQESKRRFRVLANSVPVLIWVADADGSRTWFSRQWTDFTGCDPNTQAPYPWSDFVHPEDRKRCLQRIAEASAAGHPFDLEYRLAHIDGSFRWVMDTATPRFNDSGALAGYIGSCVDINARKEAEAGLHKRESLLRSIYDASSAAIFMVDLDGRITHANHRMAEIFGQPMASLIGGEYVKLIDASEHQAACRNLRALLTRKLPSLNLERRYLRGDGSQFWGLITCRPLHDGDGEICGLVGVVADVTARKEAETGMALAAGVFESCHEGIFITDAEHRIISVNRAFTTITGYSADEAIHRDDSFLASKRHPEAFFAAMQHALDTTDHWEGEIWNRHRDGPIYPAWLAITRICGPSGQVSNYAAIFSDISERKKTDARMHHLAHYDYLTDLPNRALLLERLNLTHSTARRYGKHFAVLFADLDLFKQVNDDYGHNVGDTLLIEVARRLKSVTRESDTVSRQGGDEFVILAPEIHEPVKLLELAEKLRDTIAQPCNILGHRITVAVSIGIAIFPRDGESVDDIMRAADSAMYRAKNAGHNKIRFASASQGGGKARTEDEAATANRPLYVISGTPGPR